MTGALLGTKLYVPQLRRGSVGRPRLMRRMGAEAEARLTLLSAPAGFGKTTVLAEWLREAAAADRSVAWLSLDATDNEPASFWTYVATALEGAVPGVGTGALAALAAHRLRVDGHLDQHWSSWFGDLILTHEDDGTTCLTGAITDQAQLHGLLTKIRDLGVTLISAEVVHVTTTEQAAPPTRKAT